MANFWGLFKHQEKSDRQWYQYLVGYFRQSTLYSSWINKEGKLELRWYAQSVVTHHKE